MKTSQAEKLRRLLSDGQPHSTIEILERVYGGSHLGIARVGARIHDLKAKGHEITGWKDEKNPAVYFYRMKVKPKGHYETVMRDGVPYAKWVEPTVHNTTTPRS